MASFIHQFEHEPFWRYYWRLGDSLPCDHGIEMWEMCNLMFEGLNVETENLVEFMHNGVFLAQPIEQACGIFEWLSKDTYDLEMANMHTHYFSASLDIPQPNSHDHFKTDPSYLAPMDGCNMNDYCVSPCLSLGLGGDLNMENGDLVSFLPSLYPLPLIDCRLDLDDTILNSIKGLIEKCKAISQDLSELFLSYNNEPCGIWFVMA